MGMELIWISVIELIQISCWHVAVSMGIRNLVFNPWVNIEDVTVLYLIATMAGTCRDPNPQQHQPRGRSSWRVRRTTILSPWPRNCEKPMEKSRVYPQIFGTFRNPESQWNLRRLEKNKCEKWWWTSRVWALNFGPKKQCMLNEDYQS